MKEPRVCVVGSINMDLITVTNKMPNKGETIIGDTFYTYPGGKGANQAVAASKLGANVTMVGAIGDDVFGNDILRKFKEKNINHNNVKIIPNTHTGIATVILTDNDNRIIVASGANENVTPDLINEAKDDILSNEIILLQLEIPMETVEYTVDLAYKNNIPVIINPAPFSHLSDNIVKKATFFTPNEIEFQHMKELALFNTIKHKIIITKGDEGVEYINPNGKPVKRPAYKVPVLDTTGAGDTFNGAFAVELANTNNLDKAVLFANAAAGASIGKLGAQEGMPNRNDIVSFMKKEESNLELLKVNKS